MFTRGENFIEKLLQKLVADENIFRFDLFPFRLICIYILGSVLSILLKNDSSSEKFAMFFSKINSANSLLTVSYTDSTVQCLHRENFVGKLLNFVTEEDIDVLP